MTVRTIYANGAPLDQRPSLNAEGCSLAIGVGSDNKIAFSVFGFGGANANEYGHDAFAIIERTEARAIYEALGRELADG